jgi:hypothetical protein
MQPQGTYSQEDLAGYPNPQTIQAGVERIEELPGQKNRCSKPHYFQYQ